MATTKTSGSQSAAKTARKTPARKTSAKPEAKPEAGQVETRQDATQTPESSVVVMPLPEDGGVTLKKKELIDLVVAHSGVRKRDVKPVIEAALSILGEALSEGRELNLQPLGKLKVTRMKKGGNGQIINARVRQPEENATPRPVPDNGGDDPLAQAAE